MVGSISELLDYNVRHRANAVALRCEGQEWSWRDVDAFATSFAHRLLSAGVAAQDRIVYIGKNGPGCFITMFATAKIRAIYTPLNWRLTASEVGHLLDDVSSPFIVCETAFTAAAEAWAFKQPQPAIVEGVESLWQAISPASTLPIPADRASQPADIAFQLYTSGTTGAPKGAMFANGTNVKTLLEKVSVAWDFTPRDVSLAVMPLFHMGGLAWALAGMACGVTTVILSDFDAVEVLDICQRENVTMAFFVPAMLNAILDVPDLGQRELRLRRLVYSGAPMAPSTLITAMKELDSGFTQIYGLTEATGAFAQLEPGDHDPGGPREHLLLSAGRPYPWVEVKIVDVLTQRDLPPGDSGEIWTRSAQNLVGYFNQPVETSAALTPEGWLRTGDLGYLDSEGYLFLRDRRKDMIISGGENVYPAEVEKVLEAYPAVAEATVIGVPSEKWGETVKAVVAPKAGHTIDPGELVAFCRERIAAFKCPTSVDLVENLPRTATGKVRKDVVREPYWRGHDRRIS